ncbi:ligase-associated DNA damage response exonuclease [Alteromonas sp. 345S023]|uniref:Ligase-associated DNA damage response exonuclease n=1 Tax=Alteromonas profundi TaxID=2696062 RepID=A0A7X5LP15_9ALTE|nr:ligase-associated DNA damage response exonuclease [Alteromonas profundi]NDV92932.1 ligase-associated DNA damage response exonuclease [Alteromonas profundi]
MHPSQWMKIDNIGLYCKPGDFYIDPMSPVQTALVTHGHADHAREGHKHVFASHETLAIMRTRYGEEMADEQQGVAMQTPLTFNDVVVTFYPAGHILGSTQILIEYAGYSVVVSGDYKRRHDPTCPPFEVIPCDVFITEATFALPVFRHPPIGDEIAKLLHSLAVFPSRCHLVGAYALGKCQRVILALREAGYDAPIYLHGAQIKLCQLYQQFDIALGELIPVSEVVDKQTLAGEIVIAPPSALADRWSRSLPNVRTVMVSGWMQIRARAKQRNAELPLIISDHCDWPELLQTIEEVNPTEVWVTHGREDALIYQARKMGYRARALSMVGYDEDEQGESFHGSV